MTDLPGPLMWMDAEAWLRHRGTDPADMLRAGDHFETWRLANGLPAVDAAGRAMSESLPVYERYRDAPDGETLRPPYASLRDWLFLSYGDVPWSEGGDARTKTVVLERGSHAPLPDPTEDEIERRTADMMEDADPLDLPDDIEDHVREDIRWSAARHNAALAIVDILLDRYGSPLPLVLTA